MASHIERSESPTNVLPPMSSLSRTLSLDKGGKLPIIMQKMKLSPRKPVKRMSFPAMSKVSNLTRATLPLRYRVQYVNFMSILMFL